MSAAHGTLSATPTPGGDQRPLTVEVGSGGIDSTWDEFVHSSPGGHHIQTSGWAQAKAALGWEAIRVVGRREGEVVAGLQLLVRRLGRLVGVGYVPRGPIASPTDPAALVTLLEALESVARAERIVYLKLQPPVDRPDMAAVLDQRGWVKSDLDVSPSSTVRVDLRPDEEELLRAMRSRTRGYVRQGERKGLTVREGGPDDLATFSQLVAATGERQGFPAYPQRYYEAIWRSLASDGRGALLLVEHAGTALSGALLIGCGDTVTYKMGGWAGDGAAVHPNELLHWTGMLWARARGYRWYDFEGIPRTVAEALVGGDAPSEARRGVTHFKLGFGGEVALFPPTYDLARPRPAALALRHLGPRLGRATSLAQRLLGRGR